MDNFAQRFSNLLLLLGALYVLLLTIPFVPLIVSQEFPRWFYGNATRTVEIVFGIILGYLLRSNLRIAISVGILSAVYPLYGSVFYLIVSHLENLSNE